MIELLDSHSRRNYLILYSIEKGFVTYILDGKNLDYISIGGELNDIVYIDPPGGPFMSIGTFQHRNMILYKIEHVKNVGFKLIFKL